MADEGEPACFLWATSSVIVEKRATDEAKRFCER
jgi:hypothetical protein